MSVNTSSVDLKVRESLLFSKLSNSQTVLDLSLTELISRLYNIINYLYAWKFSQFLSSADFFFKMSIFKTIISVWIQIKGPGRVFRDTGILAKKLKRYRIFFKIIKGMWDTGTPLLGPQIRHDILIWVDYHQKTLADKGHL